MSHSLHACLTIPRCAVQLAACRGRFERSLPIIVAHGTTDRATVVDMSAAAAEAGIYRGMLVWAARRRCRSVRIISYDADAMAYASTVVMEVLKRHTDAITDEPPDRWLFRLCALGGDCARAPTIAEQLCEELRAETDLGGHLGLASHPTLARIAAQVAAERDAPAIVVPTDGIAAFLHPLPVTMLPGVGVKTQIALERLGVTTIGHLVDIPPGVLAPICGTRAPQLIRAARGLPPTEALASPTVVAEWWSGDEPELDPRVLHVALYRLTEQVGRELRSRATATGTLTVDVTWTDGMRRRASFRWLHRCDLDRELASGSRALLDALLAERRVAVIGLRVAASDLGLIQRDLLHDEDRRGRQLQTAMDGIKRRYGPDAILPAVMLHRRAERRAA